MAHFAQLNNDNVVMNVIVISDDDAPTEKAGQTFIASLGLPGIWKQTSYNTQYVYEYEFDDSESSRVISATIVGSIHTQGGTPFRGKYAAIGDLYDPINDVFVAPPVEEDATE